MGCKSPLDLDANPVLAHHWGCRGQGFIGLMARLPLTFAGFYRVDGEHPRAFAEFCWVDGTWWEINAGFIGLMALEAHKPAGFYRVDGISREKTAGLYRVDG